MSYNHEPQFNTQSVSVQDLVDYITMKREWLHYIEGYSDNFPDYRDYRERFIELTSFGHWSDNIKHLIESKVYELTTDLLNLSNPTVLDEIQLVSLVGFGMRYKMILSGRYSLYKLEAIQLSLEDQTLQEIYETFRENAEIATVCNDCGEWTLNHDITYIDDEAVCESCRDSSYTYSEYLECWIFDDNVTRGIDAYGHECVLDTGDIPCEFNWNEDEDRYEHQDFEDRTIIGEYHSNRNSYAPINSDWSRKNKRFFGVELEVEVKSAFSRHERAKNIKEFVDDNFPCSMYTEAVVFERDGSLDNGFEIISQPMGLDKHKELWLWTNESTITEGLRSHLTGTCGLHVHVSREGLTNLQIARAVYFVNHQANRHLIETVARRYNAGYCKAKSKKISTAARAEDRYEMINLQNRKTIEFRIFKGSLKYEAIIAAIEFCHAVLNFSATNSNLHLSTEAFLKFIFEHQNRADTAVLRQYLMDRNPTFRKDFERLIKPEMKKLIPAPDLTLVARNAELIEV